ncbi:MAG: signal peptidase I [Tyzzerella sp.]|nr:signal peptidase I [Tyzzerella sp.]
MERKHRERYNYLRKKKLREKKRKERLQNLTKEQKIFREILGWIAYIVIVIGATYFIVTYVGQRTKVSGDSMEATLHDEDNLIVDKISYRFRDPKRFEIIVFPYKYMENTYYIKRIIGLPGETVQIIDGYVYINGSKLNESYGLEVIESTKYGIAEEPVVLGEDEYFVLGDNRNHSSDSRDSSVGVLKREDLIGRAWIRIWPLDSIGVISHE